MAEKEQEKYVITLYNGATIGRNAPKLQSNLESKRHAQVVKGEYANGGSKPAYLVTGAMVRVPLFINIGEI